MEGGLDIFLGVSQRWGYRYIGWVSRCILCSISTACPSCCPTDRGTEREQEGARMEGAAHWAALLYLLLSCLWEALEGTRSWGPGLRGSAPPSPA